MEGIAAAKAGARFVRCADIDPYACAAIALNAAANGVNVETCSDDLIGSHEASDVILVGDMCYEHPLTEKLLDWLCNSSANVLLGDPGRS